MTTLVSAPRHATKRLQLCASCQRHYMTRIQEPLCWFCRGFRKKRARLGRVGPVKPVLFAQESR